MKLVLAFVLSLTPALAQIRIACGSGVAVTDANGVVWQADGNFTGGLPWAVPGNAGVYANLRFGAGTFSYNLAVPSGAYSLTLKFAEVVQLAPGSRQFSVTANGVTLATVDLAAIAGALLPGVPLLSQTIDVKLPVTVTNGTLLLGFATLVRSAIVSGIDLEPVTSTPSSGTGVAMIQSTPDVHDGQQDSFATAAAVASNTRRDSGSANRVAHQRGTTLNPRGEHVSQHYASTRDAANRKSRPGFARDRANKPT